MHPPGGSILLIDDNPLFLKLLSETFQENGFSVTTASDGIEGIKAFIDNSPDVVICDMIMPRMGGVSACMEISRRAGSRQPVIVLLTSMFHGAPHEHEMPEMGARVHISKSTSPLDVVIIVEQLLERKKILQTTD